MHSTEEAIVRSFIPPHRRPRWLLSLSSAKRRSRFLNCLNHCKDLDPRYCQWLPSNANVVGLLRSHGEPAMCFVLSVTDAIDVREMPLEEAVLAAEMGGWGTIISCIPGRLGYFYDECGERRFLLVRDEE